MKIPRKLLILCSLVFAFIVLSALPAMAASSWYVVKKSVATTDAIFYCKDSGGGSTLISGSKLNKVQNQPYQTL